MRDLPSEFVNEINKRGGIRPRTFVRFRAKTRDNPSSQVWMGLWNGIDVQNFNIAGRSDTYYGAGSLLDLEDIVNAVGTGVQSYTLKLAPLAPEVATLIRAYEPRGARVEIFTALFSTESGLLITPTVLRRFKGWIDKIKIAKPASNGQGSASITLVSSARNLTSPVPSRRSNANQLRRNASDNMLRYVAVSGQVETPWGAERINAKDRERQGSVLQIINRLRG